MGRTDFIKIARLLNEFCEEYFTNPDRINSEAFIKRVFRILTTRFQYSTILRGLLLQFKEDQDFYNRLGNHAKAEAFGRAIHTFEYFLKEIEKQEY